MKYFHPESLAVGWKSQIQEVLRRLQVREIDLPRQLEKRLIIQKGLKC